MSIPPPPPLRPPPDPAQQTQELLKFLREENEANRKAVREDAAASRDLLLSTTKIVAIPVAVALSIGAWLGYKSIGDLKDTLEQQAKSTTQVEIGKMQDNIHKRLTEQFETPALQKMVRDTAAEYTKTQAEPLIKSEVSARVAEAVRNSVGSAVKTQIQPAIEKVKTVSDLQGLILRMDNDDANAFDDLEALSMAKTENDEIDRLMKTAVNNVRAAHDGMPNFPSPLDSSYKAEESVAVLDSSDPNMRIAALWTFRSKGYPQVFLPQLSKVVQIATSDASLNVRCAAARYFYERTIGTTVGAMSHSCLDKDAVREWWVNRGKSEPAPK